MNLKLQEFVQSEGGNNVNLVFLAENTLKIFKEFFYQYYAEQSKWAFPKGRHFTILLSIFEFYKYKNFTIGTGKNHN